MNKYRSHFIVGEAEFTIVSDLPEILAKAQPIAREIYDGVAKFAADFPIFRDSFDPTHFAGMNPHMPKATRRMEEVTKIFGVGPMAAVAGAIADILFENLQLLHPKLLLVEDGGEMIIQSTEPVTVGLYAGLAVLGSQVGFEINPSEMPLGIATSSATVSHAISLGQADAATIFARDATIADAAATYFCNNVKGDDVPQSIQRALALFPNFGPYGVKGAFIVREGHVGTAGTVPRLVKIKGEAADIIAKK